MADLTGTISVIGAPGGLQYRSELIDTQVFSVSTSAVRLWKLRSVDAGNPIGKTHYAAATVVFWTFAISIALEF
jgi:hypothetical protein